jgi:hypothetical protein
MAPRLPPAAPRRPVTLLVIGTAADLALLRLQAQSFARHLADEPGRRILVVNSDDDEAAFAAAFHAQVLPHYGRHAPQVELLPASAILEGQDAPASRRASALRWAMARLIEPGLYLTLDSGNLLVRAWGSDDLFLPDGRMRMLRRPLSAALEPSFRYFVPPDPDALPDAPPDRRNVSNVWTPYLLATRHVIDMTEEIARREGSDAAAVLDARPELIDNALYWAFLVARGTDRFYDLLAPPNFAGVGTMDPAVVAAALTLAEDPAVAWFGLNRRVARADPALRAPIAALLTERGLFDDTEAAVTALGALR